MVWGCGPFVNGWVVSVVRHRFRVRPARAQGFLCRYQLKVKKESKMASQHNNRISVLIVDDHEVVRKGIRSYIETVKDFQVIGEASSGEEALKLVSEHIPDIVLLDLIMPGMDGVETTRRIKHIRSSSTIS